MAIILDPDLLVRASTQSNTGVDGNIWIDTTTKTIRLREFGSLTPEGVSLQAVYSYLKEEWINDPLLIKFTFPIDPVDGPSGNQFDIKEGWDFEDITTKNLIKDAGWALKDASGVSLEEYANITTLGIFQDANSDQAYYLQVDGGTPVSAVLTGPVNQAVKIYGDVSHGSVDYRNFFTIFLREQGKSYDSYDLLTSQSLTSLTYKKYAMPLSNSIDLKVTENDATVDAYGVTITYYQTPQIRNIGGTDYNYNIIIDGNNKTAEEIYMAVQSALRKVTDIDDGAGTVRGDIADSLLKFVGDTLETKVTSDGGVFIDNYQTTDVNRIVFVDNTGIPRTFPYVAALTLNFNQNLVNDPASVFRVFFTDANGNSFGTTNAIIVKDDSDVDMSGSISGATSQFSFNYDGNTQGGRTPGTDANITVVAIGLTTGQYVQSTGTIKRSTANTISLNANLERTYANP